MGRGHCSSFLGLQKIDGFLGHAGVWLERPRGVPASLTPFLDPSPWEAEFTSIQGPIL